MKGVCYFYFETGTEGAYWAFLDKKQDSFYDRLHILKDGDHLTIFSKDNPKEVVWSGIISLAPHPLFTENASGFWIHADQKNIDREVWANYFFKEFPAELIPNRKHKTQ